MPCDIVFVCQAGEIAKQASLLAASVRLFGGTLAGAPLHALIPVPEEVYGAPSDDILKFLDGLGVRLYHRRNPIDDAYKHANKLNAFTIDAQTEEVVFLDSDTVVFGDFSDILQAKRVDVLLRPTAVKHWPPRGHGDELWAEVYREFNLAPPSRRVRATETKTPMLPYFSAAVIMCSSRANLSDAWIRVGRTLYGKDLPRKYPFLDQISLPVAITLAHLTWDTLDPRYNLGLGLWLLKRKLGWGLRFFRWYELPPTLSDACILHYQSYRILELAAREDVDFRRKFETLRGEIPLPARSMAVPLSRSVARRISNAWTFRRRPRPAA